MTEATQNTAENQLHMATERAPLIAIASGKGGVGKTSLTLNLARSLAKAGKKVLVFDADLGLANIDVQLGLNPERDLSDVIKGKATLMEVITHASDVGVDIIPGRSGSHELPFTTSLDRQNILRDITDLARSYDVVLLDVAAGAGDEALVFSRFADRTLLVVTPDPSSITDAYAVIKLLKVRHNCTNCEVVINQASNDVEGRSTYEKMRMAAERFLKVHVPLAGVVPYDRNYGFAVRTQTLLTDAFPNGASTKVIADLAQNLHKKQG